MAVIIVSIKQLKELWKISSASPKYALNPKETGIIAPYKNQVEALSREISNMDADTVHKFQGKEKENIIISTVDDEISDFADDPYLINVAVSRARKRLLLVVTGNEQTKFPLNMLIKNLALLNEQECRFAMNPAAHLDFLIYNRIGKKPVLAIEVDGYENHKKGTAQAARDLLKDHILELYHIPLLRFKTNGSGEKEKIVETLENLVE